jgi:hypothetical protein
MLKTIKVIKIIIHTINNNTIIKNHIYFHTIEIYITTFKITT